MFETFCLGVALTVGQGGPAQPIPAAPGRAVVGDEAPRRIPAALPAVTVQTAPLQAMPVQMKDVPMTPAAPKADATAEPKNGNGEAKEEEKKEEEEPEEVGHFMQLIAGTCLGSVLEEKKIKVSGWVAASYTYTNPQNTINLPVTWNDRANTFLLQQFWVNVEKPIDTEAKDITYGFKVAFLAGSDYRFTLPRGFFDSQLKNTRLDPNEPNGFQQNLYGVDLPLFYANAYLPGIGGEGTEVAIGRMYTPWGVESVEAATTPLMSRSYAFNWAPPFFHTGIMVAPTFNKNVSAKLMLVNGNDVFFDGSDEMRGVGAITFKDDDGNSSLTLAASVGRGKFNTGKPNGPAQGITTLGLAYEPAGRNNINVFDLVYTQKLSDELSYALELVYGYQDGVPAGATGSAANFNGAHGTARWAGAVKYLTYNFSDEMSGVLRGEVFYDAEGQRTGFEGAYWAGTAGLQFKPTSSILFRPEVRYDYNGYSRPFEGKHGIFTAGADLIFKF